MAENPQEEKVTSRSFSLPPRLIEWIEAEAKKENRSASNFLCTLVEKAMR